MFNSLLIFSGLASSGGFEEEGDQGNMALVQNVIGQCLEREDCCNEFYLQLIKQTTDQPDPNGSINVANWRFFVLTLGVVIPRNKVSATVWSLALTRSFSCCSTTFNFTCDGVPLSLTPRRANSLSSVSKHLPEPSRTRTASTLHPPQKSCVWPSEVKSTLDFTLWTASIERSCSMLRPRPLRWCQWSRNALALGHKFKALVYSRSLARSSEICLPGRRSVCHVAVIVTDVWLGC